MKKLKSLIIFSLVLFSFLGDISSAIAADNVLWLYKEISSITQTAGKSRYLATKEDCENDRTVYLKLKDAKIFNFQNNITECTSVQVDPMQRNMLITPKLIEGDYISKNNPNQNDEVIGVDPKKNENSLIDSEYKLLSPIAGFTKAPENVGDYLNKIFILAIGLCVALAVLMMIIAGVQYMGEESIFGKMNAKGQIKNALLGLLIALSAYALLNTIDPRLLGKGGVSIRAVKSVIVNLPDAGDTTVDKNCAKQNATYSTNYGVSGGVNSAISKIKSGFELAKFEVDSTTNEMTLVLKKTSDGSLDRQSKIKISPGAKGYSEIGKGASRDFKTPKGTWRILNKIETKENAAVCNGAGSNMGAGFWRLNPTTNGERGIGIHGNEAGTRTTTAGCIRITNSDLLALNPYVKVGLTVEIK